MIKRIDNENQNALPSLTSSKPRGGMQNVSRLVELLIKQYEIQDQIRQKQKQDNNRTPVAVVNTDRNTQATFAWYE